MGPEVLSELLSGLPKVHDERLIIGYDSSDDASVYLARADLAIVQTIDFFPPIVDDPYEFGLIAAANAISDIYAMGATPVTALNLILVPNCLPRKMVREILRGGADKAMEAGLIIAGGHSIEDEEPKYGLSVMGLAHPDELWYNNTPRIGDILLLTKALGTGALTTAMKVDLITKESERIVIDTMARLNKNAAEAARDLDVSAATDVTGFGLLGHAAEMAGDEKRCSLIIDSEKLPFLPEALEQAAGGILPAGVYRNRDFVGHKVDFATSVPLAYADLMFDPQTSGGLLLAMPESDVPKYLAEIEKRGETANVIGKVAEYKSSPLVVV